VSTAGTSTAGPAMGQDLPDPARDRARANAEPGPVGVVSFLASEVALFSTLIVTYVFYLGKDVVGPTPAEALSLPLVLFTTACLLASSATIHRAEKTLGRGNQGGFLRWWMVTIGLGVVFLLGTAYEWYGLIYHHHLTIGRNLFGTTYYTLVGLHALHVTGGVIVMLTVLGLALCRQVTTANRAGGRPGVLVLALCGRRLGGRVYGGLPGGAVASFGVKAHELRPVGFGPRNETRMAGMASESQGTPHPERPAVPESVEMPRPTAAPLVLAVGLALLARRGALRPGVCRRRRRGRRCGPGNLDRPTLAGPGGTSTSPWPSGAPAPTGDGHAGWRGTVARGRARLPPAPAAGRSSHLRRPHRRPRRRVCSCPFPPSSGAW